MKKASKAQVREIREFLRKKSSRDEAGVFVAEGVKIVKEALSRELNVRLVLLSSRVIGAPSSKEISELASKAKAEIFRVPAPEFEKLSSLKSSQGVMAVVEKPEQRDPKEFLKDGALAVLCDGVQDPGNLGAIIRSAAAFGVKLVLFSGETADVYNPKVVRASSGMVFDVASFVCDVPFVQTLKDEGVKICVSSCAGEDAVALDSLKEEKGRVVLVFGSEGKGVSREIDSLADIRFHIPINENVESLNVTAAATVALYELSKK